MRATFLLTLLLAAGCASAPRTVATADYDVVITGGKIVDGSGNPWRYGDVGVRGDRIVTVAPPGALANAPARQRIDATNRVVAPGFFDIQAQSYEGHLTGDGRVISKISQGVTTEILGEGGTPAPAIASVLDALGPADSQLKRAM
ncbi:MAG: hypothetical protein ABIY52_14300, partial [Gemmatimonadaceae bacterium]